jgi:hypothetical protein
LTRKTSFRLVVTSGCSGVDQALNQERSGLREDREQIV